MNTFKGFLLPCPQQGVGGIDRIWAFDHNNITDIYYSPETSNPDTIPPVSNYPSLHYGIISDIRVLDNPDMPPATPYKWIVLDVNNDESELTQELNRDGEDSYDTTLSMTVNEYNTFSRDAMEMLTTVRSVCFIILDANGRYWFMGETAGCDIEYSTTTGKDGGANNITVTAKCKERSPTKMLALGYVTLSVEIPQVEMSTSQFNAYNLFMKTPIKSKPHQIQ